MDRTATVRLRLVTSMFESAAARSGQTIRGIGNEFTRAADKSTPAMQQMGRGAMIAGTAAAVGIGIAVRAYADFDQQMSHVQAATHETAANMDLLRDAALRAGADTVFTATESANAIEQLAKAGVSTADILGGGLTGALDLAAAGSLDVGSAAEIAATAMTQFKLAGKDIPHIADLLAAGAGKAQGEVKDMALAMEYAGVPAAELGVSIEETAGTIALFAKNGIVGERAGTSLRSMIASLTSPSVKARGVLEDLNIQVFDAQGNFLGLEGVAGQLQARLGGATDAVRSNALGILFGNEALQAANVLTREGAAGVAKWTSAVDDQGYAATTAGIKLDNLRGDWEKFTGSLETALIKSGSASDGLLRTTVQSATGVVNTYAALPGPVQAGATALVAVAGAATLAGGAFIVLAPKVAAARTQLALMPRTSALVSASLRNLGKAGAAFAVWQVATLGLQALQDQIVDTVPGVESLTMALLAANDAADLESLGGGFDDIGASLARITDKGLLDKFADGYVSIFTLGSMQTNNMREATQTIEGIDEALAGLVSSGHAEEAARIFDFSAKAGAEYGISVDELRAKLPAYANALAGVDNEQTLAGESTSSLAGALTGVDTAASDAADAVEDYKGELDDLNGVNISAMQSQIELAESFDDTKEAVKRGGKVNRDERKALLDLATQINDTAAAYAEQAGTVEAGNQVLKDSRAGFIRMATAMGMSIPKANALADAVIGIPDKQQTKYETKGAPKAQSDAANVADAIYSIPGHRISHLGVSGVSAAVAQVNALNRALRSTSGAHVSIDGAGTGITKANGGRLPYGLGFAGGGRIPSWMGGPRQDNVMIAPNTWASGGEYVVNEPATRANLGLLEAINSGRVKSFAAGGHYGGGGASGGGVWRLHPEDLALLEAIASRPLQGDAYLDGERVGRIIDRSAGDRYDSLRRGG